VLPSRDVDSGMAKTIIHIQSSDERVVFGVGSNPKPQHAISHFNAEGAMVKTSAN
jgi:hypothetical protein